METKAKQKPTGKTTGRKKTSPNHHKTVKSQEKPILKVQVAIPIGSIPKTRQNLGG